MNKQSNKLQVNTPAQKSGIKSCPSPSGSASKAATSGVAVLTGQASASAFLGAPSKSTTIPKKDETKVGASSVAFKAKLPRPEDLKASKLVTSPKESATIKFNSQNINEQKQHASRIPMANLPSLEKQKPSQTDEETLRVSQTRVCEATTSKQERSRNLTQSSVYLTSNIDESSSYKEAVSNSASAISAYSAVSAKTGAYEPESVRLRNRINFLKGLQIKQALNKLKFTEEQHLLECKYNKMNTQYRELAAKTVVGDFEPVEEDVKQICGSSLKCKSFENDQTLEATVAEIIQNADSNDKIKGIPGFWLGVLKRIPMTAGLIEAHDEPILKHLVDVDLELKETKPYCFTLKFCFSPNEYFANSVLTKTYLLRTNLDEEFPFLFDPTEIKESVGCEIMWKSEEKDVTIKRLNSSQEAGRFKPADSVQFSFFNFFNTSNGISLMESTGLGALVRSASASSASSMSKDSNFNEHDMGTLFDHEIGLQFKDKIVPHAVLYFTGDLVEFEDPKDDFQADMGLERSGYSFDSHADLAEEMRLHHLSVDEN